MSDVITQVTAPEQTGVANPADAIAAMIAANKRNNPQPDGSSPPPAGQEEAQAKSPEAAPVEGVEPEDGSSVESDAVESEVEAEATDGVTEAVDFLEFAKENQLLFWVKVVLSMKMLVSLKLKKQILKNMNRSARVNLMVCK